MRNVMAAQLPDTDSNGSEKLRFCSAGNDLDLTEYIDLHAAFCLVEKALHSAGDLLSGQGAFDLGPLLVERGHDAPGIARAEIRHKYFAIIAGLVLGGDDDERSEAKIDILVDRHALGDDLKERRVADRVKTDGLKPRFKRPGRGEI